jgi:hypothetical protein
MAAYSTSQGGGISDGGNTTVDSPSVVVPANSVVYVLAGSSELTPAAATAVAADPTGANQALTQIGTSIFFGAFGTANLWRIINPNSGTYVFRATWGGNQGQRFINVWVGTGIDSVTPNGTVVQNSGTSNNNATTGSITTTAGQLVLALMAHMNSSADSMTYNSPTGTERQDFVTSGAAFNGSESQDTTAAGSSTTLSATLTGASTAESWAAFGIPINDLNSNKRLMLLGAG